MNDLISVIIPIYNVEKYLARCVESVINQIYDNLEIILIDDGSTDNSSCICDQFEMTDKRIRVIHKENGGVSSARNVGLEHMTGKYVMFLDSDDFLEKNCISRMLELMNKYKVPVVQCDFEEGDKDLFCKSAGKVTERLYCDSKIFGDRKIKITVWGKLYDAKLFHNIRFPIVCNEDEFVTYKVLYYAGKIATTNEKLYYYYKNDNSIMRKKRNYVPIDFIKAYEERIAFFQEKKDLGAVEMTYKEFAIRLMLFYMRCCENPQNTNDKDSILQKYREYYHKVKFNKNILLREKVMLSIFYKIPKVITKFINIMR